MVVTKVRASYPITLYSCVLISPLISGHLQTIYCVTGDFSGVDRMLYRR